MKNFKNLKRVKVWKLPIFRFRRAKIGVLAAFFLMVFAPGGFSQCNLFCHSLVEVALPNRNHVTLTPEMVMTNNGQSCPNANFRIRLFDENGVFFGKRVNYTNIGQEITGELTDLNTGTTCSYQVEVVDIEPPTILTSDKFVVCSDSVLPRHLGYPEVSDNISILDTSNLQYSDAYTAFGCFTEVLDSTVTGMVERTWFAVDESGNVGTAVQMIYYVRQTIGDVVFPPNRDGFESDFLICHRDNPNNLAKTGTPTINGNSIFTFNNCEFSVTYTDQTSNICGGENRILRRWNVIDWCTDTSKTVIQVIRVRDVQAPSIVMPDTLVVATDAGKCTATVMLPDAVVYDSCSAATVRKVWAYGTGNGPFRNVPTGIHEVTYTATDACGNASSAKTAVIVEDRQYPTAICDNTKEINLLASGDAEVFSFSFNDGSHDNCSIEKMEVTRNGAPYGNKVRFDCADLGRTVKVTLRVTDQAGLASTCDVQVTVKDPVAPTITCPAGVTIDCKADILNTQLTGNATAIDNCQIGNITFNDQVQVNNCGIGTITRTWRAVDAFGNASTCSQSITTQDNTPVTVVFPSNYETFECGGSTDPSVTGQPQVNGVDCENLDISYFDQTFPTSVPACFKVLRRWTVIDWCAYNAGANGGIWNAEQTIKITDNKAPQLNLPGEITVGTSNNSCSGMVQLEPAVAIDCSPNVTITNNSRFAINPGADASGEYPLGTHIVHFTATDGCGNTSAGSVKITVIDDKPPTPICNRGITLSLNSDGQISITPGVIAQTSFDNCSVSGQIRMDVSPKVFSCADLGERTVTITATDAAGNTGTCQTMVQIQDNLGVCSAANNRASIGGKVETFGGTPANQVLIGISGGISTGRQSHIDGTYLFENLPKNKSYTITPVYDSSPEVGVSTLDLVIIQKHVLNVQPFHSPYQWIAADANRNGTVSTVDIVILRKIVLRVSNELPNNKSWRFVDARYEFPPTGNPLAAPFPEAITIPDLTYNRLNNHFVAIKIGDVNGNARLNTLEEDGIDQRTQVPTLDLTAEDVELRAGQEYDIPLFAKNFKDIQGLQFTLNYHTDLLEIQNIESFYLTNFDDRSVGRAPHMRGALTLSWSQEEGLTLNAEEAVCVVKIKALENGRLKDGLWMSSDWTKAEAYSFGQSDDGVRLWKPHLEFDVPGPTMKVKVIPNPFDERTSLTFEMPFADRVGLAIFDSHGMRLYEGYRYFSKGSQQWEIYREDLQDRSGILFYQLTVNGKMMGTGKMIRAGIHR